MRRRCGGISRFEGGEQRLQIDFFVLSLSLRIEKEQTAKEGEEEERRHH